ncbi:E3 ubiquitin-protein ligase TM129 [Leptodactylus fuscus]|uniref:E3 ubiquitin-protein ligase TM129 n=1 Tax=Leptodactylus fuscus TaxID=238119 RepID=UPI003F4E6139
MAGGVYSWLCGISPEKMESPAVTFTLAYLVFAVCFVFTPDEFRSAGFTIQNMLSRWLGTEDGAFIQYHMKRTTATMLVHGLLPLGYYIGMCIAAPEKQLYYIYAASSFWQTYALVSVIVPSIIGLFAFYWSRNKWGNHPLAKKLAYYNTPHCQWMNVAFALNSEFIRVDKFATGVPGARVIVTDKWVIKVTTYKVHLAQQRDVHLTIIDSKQHELSPDSNTPVQYLTIRVASINPQDKPFDIRLNSIEYGELRDKLRAPIRNAANVVILKTLSDLFLETFRTLVEANNVYELLSGQDLEPCIGCMQTNANVKLVKYCSEREDGECQQCNCRPMWCLTCMGKWFASRQDQKQPETWLSSQVPCPTCRAKFCIVDVCLIR